MSIRHSGSKSWSLSWNLPVAAALAGAFAAAPCALAGPDWDADNETDAGSTIGTAQVINVAGGLQTISGRLTGTAFTLGSDFQDVYQFAITDPMQFLIDLTGGGKNGNGSFANFDACLWLFSEDGTPLLGNNDAFPGSNGPMLTNMSNGGFEVLISKPGIYYLAISGFASEPVNQGEPLWPSVVFKPGIIAGANPDQTWGGDWSGEGETGEYLISVQGVSGVPAPGACVLFAAAGFGFRGRRRRR
ncbi:MAG: DVUA0089 family protein [Phycisphaerae bacterium]|nr:DVUA0089 family protein [Phycisphaerae bacterium]